MTRPLVPTPMPVVLSTTDTGTQGPLFVRGAVATVDDVITIYHVVAATNGGFSALPAAAADAAGGLPISDAGALDLDARLDAAVSSRMATYVQPTGFLAATFPAGTVANTTNITAGTITTVTNLTNAPTVGDLTAAMIASVTTAATAATPTAAAVTGAVGSVTGNVGGSVGSVAGNVVGSVGSVAGNVVGSVGSVVGAVGSVTGNVGGNVTGSVGSVVGLTVANLDTTVSSRASSVEVAALPTADENADALLDRDMSTGADSGSPTVRTPRQALRFLRNKWGIVAGVLTVTKEDDTTASWTAAVATDAAAIPIIGNDPAS